MLLARTIAARLVVNCARRSGGAYLIIKVEEYVLGQVVEVALALLELLGDRHEAVLVESARAVVARIIEDYPDLLIKLFFVLFLAVVVLLRHLEHHLDVDLGHIKPSLLLFKVRRHTRLTTLGRRTDVTVTAHCSLALSLARTHRSLAVTAVPHR